MKPITFNNIDMVKALLNTQVGVWPAKPIEQCRPYKYQTRRTIKDAPKGSGWRCYIVNNSAHFERGNTNISVSHSIRKLLFDVGDVLYVKERLYFNNNVFYYADDSPVCEYPGKALYSWRWQRNVLQARFMPYNAHRIELTVKDRRVQRLNQISLQEIIAEGTPPIIGMSYRNDRYQRRRDFVHLWDSINKSRGYAFDEVDFVVVYEFMRTR